MKPYLQAVFDSSIGRDTCAAIRQHGFLGIRIDVQKSSVDDAARWVEDARVCGLEALVIVRDAAQIDGLDRLIHEPGAVSYELRNEPDIEMAGREAEYAALARAAGDVAYHRGVRLWLGGMSSPHKRGRSYYTMVLPVIGSLPGSIGVTWHRYPVGGRREAFDKAHEDFMTREEEVQWIKTACYGRPWAISEFGYHTAPRCWGWWIFRSCGSWNDVDVAKNVSQEWSFWAEHGAEFAVLYQINDGLPNTPLNRFGIRRTDGSWKPVAYVTPR